MPSRMHDILVLSNEQMKIRKKNDRKEGGASIEGIDYCKWINLSELFVGLEKGAWEELGTVMRHRKK
jgi:hypothetical protein